MYGTELRYLASVFLDAESIEPTAHTISRLMLDLDDAQLLPTLVQERSPSGAAPRIAFRSPEGDRQLVLRGKRFDFSYNSGELGGPDIGDFPSFCRDAATKFTVLLGHFQRNAHRLAVVQEGFLPQMSQQEMEEIGGRLLHVPPIYSQHIPFEWDWRCAAVIEREFSGLKEMTNTIATVRRQPGIEILIKSQEVGVSVAEEQFYLIRVDLDINTVPRNTVPRFEAQHVVDFYDQAISWHESFAEEIGQFALGRKDR